MPVDNFGVYELLDELADMGVIDINTIVRPYGRKFISDRLVEASTYDELPSRVKNEIAFYMRDYQKEQTRKTLENKRFDIFYYSDSLFQLTVNPIVGLEVHLSGGEMAYHRFNGGELHGTIGEHFGFYASLRDNHESEILGGPDYLISRRGLSIKRMMTVVITVRREGASPGRGTGVS